MLSVLAVTTGILYGAALQEKKTFLYVNDIKKQIAIINMDEGTDTSDGRLFYSDSFIEMLGTGYVIESVNGAETGLNNGIYSAIITFPANTSECIDSINSSNPVALNISYRINSRLDTNEYVSTYEEIGNFRNNINQSLSYVYVASMLDELHSAQNRMSSLLSNCDDILIELDSLSTLQYLNALNLNMLPEVNLEFDLISADEYVLEAEGITRSIDRIMYEAYFNEYQSIADEINDITLRMDAFNEWATRVISYSNDSYNSLVEIKNALNGYCENLTSLRETYIQYGMNLSTMITNANTYYEGLNGYRQALEVTCADISFFLTNRGSVYWELYNYHNNLNNYKSALVGYDVDIQSYLGNLESYFDSINSYLTDILNYVDELEDYISSLQEDSESQEVVVEPDDSPVQISQFSIDDIPTPPAMPECEEFEVPIFYNASNLNFDIQIPGEELITMLPNGETVEIPSEQVIAEFNGTLSDLITLEPISEEQFAILRGEISIPEGPENWMEYIGDIRGAIDLLNPSNFMSLGINQNPVRSLMAEYGYLNERLASDFNMYLLGDQEKLMGAYREYLDYVSSLRTNVINTYNEETSGLENSVENYMLGVEAINEENRELIDEFVHLLPNSRVGNNINEEVVDAITMPVEFTNLSVEAEANAIVTDTSFVSIARIVFMVSAIGTVITAILVVVEIVKRKRAM